MLNADTLLTAIRDHAEALAAQRAERQRRRVLDPADFAALRDLNLHLAAVPVEYGGFYESFGRSIRPLCEIYRVLASGDSSVALSASMHPSVLSFWRDTPLPDSGAAAWEAQTRAAFSTAVAGHWWGTVMSEPGSGGDVAKTRATARWDGACWRISGEKHFGSGSGVTSFMVTVAVPEGEADPVQFYIDTRGGAWDGSSGMTLTAPWDGHGMTSTNSHGFRFTDFPATRFAWPGSYRSLSERAGGAGGIVYTSVIVGIVDVTMATMRDYWRKRGAPGSLRAFEKMEWVNAHKEAWLLHQAWEGALTALETQVQPRHAAALAKANIAELAESILNRLSRMSGGSAYSRSSPLGFWLEDVRAAGFLRPPWALAAEGLFTMSWGKDALGFW